MAEPLAVPVDVEGGRQIWVQVSPSEGMRTALGEDRSDEERGQAIKIGDLVTTIEDFAAPLASVASSLKPRTYTLTFGVTLTVETGELPKWVIGKVTGDVSAEVSLEWGE